MNEQNEGSTVTLLALYQSLFHTDDEAELGRRSRQLIGAIAESSDEELRELLGGAEIVGSSSRGLWSAYVALRFARALAPADDYMLDDDAHDPFGSLGAS